MEWYFGEFYFEDDIYNLLFKRSGHGKTFPSVPRHVEIGR